MDKDFAEFIESWHEDENGIKPLFLAACATLENIDGVSFSFKARPGVSYSLRATHKNQTTRPMFVLMDIIDDIPAARWLSACFYADMVTDPDGYGDVVPNGLLGENACCFDIEQTDSMAEFLLAKLREAAKNASTLPQS